MVAREEQYKMIVINPYCTDSTAGSTIGVQYEGASFGGKLWQLFMLKHVAYYYITVVVFQIYMMKIPIAGTAATS